MIYFRRTQKPCSLVLSAKLQENDERHLSPKKKTLHVQNLSSGPKPPVFLEPLPFPNFLPALYEFTHGSWDPLRFPWPCSGFPPQVGKRPPWSDSGVARDYSPALDLRQRGTIFAAIEKATIFGGNVVFRYPLVNIPKTMENHHLRENQP